MGGDQQNVDAIGRFVAIPPIPHIEVTSLGDILSHYERGLIPFYILTRQNKFDDSVRSCCKIYEVLENGMLIDNFH